MKTLRVLPGVCVAVLLTSPAMAQFGLYGSPDVLNLPQASQAYPGHAAAAMSPDVSQIPHGARQTAHVLTAEMAGVPEPPPPPSPGGEKPRAPGLVDKMLDEPCGCAEYERCRGEAECAGSCAGCGPAPCLWYASISGLIMSRDLPNRVWTTYEDGNESNQLTHTQFGMSWKGGGEITFGRRFCCHGHRALEATYWTLDPFSGEVRTTHASGVASPLQFNEVYFGAPAPGTNAAQWFSNAAAEHVLRRSNEIHNVEINLIHYPMVFDREWSWDFDWMVGARFFRFDERLTFGSLRNGGSWANGADQAYLSDRAENNLIGIQLGCDVGCQLAPAWRLYASPRFGIYTNHARNLFEMYLGDGTIANQTAYPGETYPVRSNRNNVSFLTEIDMGVEWQFAQNWNAKIGYRLLAITGVALADNQIPPYVVDIPEIRDIDTNGNLILHGAFASLEYNF